MGFVWGFSVRVWDVGLALIAVVGVGLTRALVVVRGFGVAEVCVAGCRRLLARCNDGFVTDGLGVLLGKADLPATEAGRLRRVGAAFMNEVVLGVE